MARSAITSGIKMLELNMTNMMKKVNIVLSYEWKDSPLKVLKGKTGEFTAEWLKSDGELHLYDGEVRMKEDGTLIIKLYSIITCNGVAIRKEITLQ